ncbi:MAG: hypothetical protein E6I18_11760 [Chloroflexi bacterium]|nr:MAG: hypothetical protein E6I18_11760 [Chloroflexota bacterium]
MTALAPLKLVPLICTLVPTGPLVGVKSLIVGGAGGVLVVSPPAHPLRVNAEERVSIPTSPVG